MKKLTFNFNFSLAELIQRADKVLVFITRDLTHFARFGYTIALIETIKALVDEMREILPDDFYTGQQKTKTSEKNECRQNLDRLLSDLKLRAKYALGEKSYEYQSYSFHKLAHMNDKDLVTFVLHLVNTAKGHLEKLASRNVDQKLLDTIMELRTHLDKKLDEQQINVSLRREMRVKRTQVANELYKKLGEACEVGKSIWMDTNEAFFTDYIIYGSKKTIQEVEDLEDNDKKDE